MRIQTYTRMFLSKEEQAIRKTWGKEWEAMRREEKRHGWFTVMVGTYQGSTEGRNGTAHVQWVQADMAPKVRLRSIAFPNGDMIRFEMRRMTVQAILQGRTCRHEPNRDLVDGARSFCVIDFKVPGVKEVTFVRKGEEFQFETTPKGPAAPFLKHLTKPPEEKPDGPNAWWNKD